MIRTICPNRGEEINLKELSQNKETLENFYTKCDKCKTEFDIDFDMSNLFITDIPKMADFKILTKEEFLQSYSYLTEKEYDITKLYMDWLNVNYKSNNKVIQTIRNLLKKCNKLENESKKLYKKADKYLDNGNELEWESCWEEAIEKENRALGIKDVLKEFGFIK